MIPKTFKEEDFDTTIESLDEKNWDCDVWEILLQLNCSKRLSVNDPKSIMTYETICNCDSGFLCEHRLHWLAEAMRNMYNRY